MDKLKKLLTLTLVIPVLAGCNQKSKDTSSNTDTGSSDVSTDTGDTSTGSSTATPPKSFYEVLDNNTYYNVYFKSFEGSKIYHEINEPNIFTYIPRGYGYAIPEGDSQFMHFFALSRDPYDYSLIMEMNGRYALANDFQYSAKEDVHTFHSILTDYAPLFKQDEENPWKFVAKSFAPSRDFKNFFQLNAFGFCDYYEIIVGKDGKITNFNAGETGMASGEAEAGITEELYLEQKDSNDVPFYEKWKEDGSKIVDRIMDYKTFYRGKFGYMPCYENGDIDAIVTSVGYDGSFYISNVNNIHGPAGMKVISTSPVDVSIGDKVNVKGNINMDTSGIDTASPYFVNADVTILGHNFSVPSFNEESIADTHGEGIYAVNILSRSPIFSGSLYYGYGYPRNIPEFVNTLGDTVIELVCPMFNNESTGKMFSMELRIPFSYGEEKINQILEECRNAGDYAKKPEESKPVCLQNVIAYYSFERELSLDLYVMKDSVVSHKFSYVETIENDYGYTNFPTLKTEGGSGFFHFGDNANWLIENQYGIQSEEHLYGVFSFHQSASTTDVNKYFQELENYGAIFLNTYMLSMTGFLRHNIYSYKDLYIDVMFEEQSGVISGQVQIFVYRAEKELRCKNIQEKIDAACGSYFSGEEFIILPDTVDCNYHFYNVPGFAGNEFGLENPLHIATVDIRSDRYDELRQAYRDAGWKIYRNEDNKAFSYNARGNTRVVYYKDNENGKKTFLDFGMYPKSDYTFLGSVAFTHRIEIAIYEGETPFKTQYTQDLTQFVTDMTESCPRLAFEWTLPSKYKAEYYSNYNKYDEVDFGYCNNFSDVFIYPESNSTANVDELHNYIIGVLLEHGYKLLFNGEQGSTYCRDDLESTIMYASSYVYVQKKSDRGFVRMRSSLGGVDF